MNGFIVSISGMRYHQNDDRHTIAFSKKATAFVDSFQTNTIKLPSFLYGTLKEAMDRDNREPFKAALYKIIQEKIGDFSWDDFTIQCGVYEVKDGLVSQWIERPNYL